VRKTVRTNSLQLLRNVGNYRDRKIDCQLKNHFECDLDHTHHLIENLKNPLHYVLVSHALRHLTDDVTPSAPET